VTEYGASILNSLIELQGWVRQELSGTLDAARTGDWRMLAAILPLGAFFGLVHALTPGHGKAVLASYLVGSRVGVARSATIAWTLAATHIASAVVVAGLAASLVTRTLVGAGRAPMLEALSGGLLVLIGAWLLSRALGGHSHARAEGRTVAVVVGLVPCPLTLFAMVLAISRGVPELGLMFAAAMMIGVAVTLSLVAAAAVVARGLVVRAIARHTRSIESVSRGLDVLSSAILMLFGALALLGR
jgi:ABC-type nickel/cobalt efflux system permease component RcnA